MLRRTRKLWFLSFLSVACVDFFPIGSFATTADDPRFRSRRQAARVEENVVPRCNSILMTLRAGQTGQVPNDNDTDFYPTYDAPPASTTNNYEDGFTNFNPPPNPGEAVEQLFHETVQERVDRWRSEQLKKSQTMTPGKELNPRDDQGRMKLLASVSRSSRALIFFILMWRDVHLFEIADQTLKGFSRKIVVIPLIMLFIGNLAGVVASLTSPGLSAKKRMKAILNLDKLIEALLIVWYMIRLTVAPSKFVPMEVFVANTLHSVFFLIQCQAYTRLTWDEGLVSTSQLFEQATSAQTNYQQSQKPTPEQSYVNNPDQYPGYQSNIGNQ